jgi:hypothetical protein
VALPDDTALDDHLKALLDEMADTVGSATTVQVHDGLVARADFDNTRITYDPAYSANSANTDDVPYRTACVLHEIMHFSVEWQYNPRPLAGSPGDVGLESINYHYAAGPAYQYAAQGNTVRANLQQIGTVAAADPALTAAIRAHVAGRLAYGDATPHVHYDTVLLDLLVYLRLKNRAASRTYRYLRLLSEEAKDRRFTNAGGPVPAAPAPPP